MLPRTRRYTSAVLVLCIVSVLAACGASSREKALSTSLTALNAARDGFVKWDEHKQSSIVASATSIEDGRQQLADYRSKRAAVVEAFTVAYSAIALAALDDNLARLTEALNAAHAVYRLVQELTGDGDPVPDEESDT